MGLSIHICFFSRKSKDVEQPMFVLLCAFNMFQKTSSGYLEHGLQKLSHFYSFVETFRTPKKQVSLERKFQSCTLHIELAVRSTNA